MLDSINKQLSAHLDATIVDKILEHYHVLKTAYCLQDWEKCLVRAGKFAEAIMKGICFLRTGQITDSISIETEINEVAKRTDLHDSIRLLIPRAVRVIYDNRSKRGGAHISPFDPNPMDCMLVTNLADWVLAELVRLYYTTDPKQAAAIVDALIAKSIPLVERIGEDYIVLSPGASARQEIGLILYSRYPERTTPTELIKWMPYQSPENIRTSLRNMERAKEVHRNKDGVVLTQLGIRVMEQNIQLITQSREKKDTLKP